MKYPRAILRYEGVDGPIWGTAGSEPITARVVGAGVGLNDGQHVTLRLDDTHLMVIGVVGINIEISDLADMDKLMLAETINILTNSE